jgi:tetratricopeptide (TPR) repeat protein
MGERFLFQPSLGFSIFAGYFIFTLFTKLKINPKIRIISLNVLLCLMIFVLGYRTIVRNNDWHTEYGLYLKDVNASPNSAIANNYAGVAIINYTDKEKTLQNKKELLYKSVEYCQKAAKIYPGYYDAYINTAISLIRLGELEKAEKPLKELKRLNPLHPRLSEMNNYLANEFNNRAVNSVNKKDLNAAIYNFAKATEYNPNNARYWYDLGGASYTNKNYKKAFEAWNQCIKINPNYTEAINGLKALNAIGINK